jgi:hypothetical protein
MYGKSYSQTAQDVHFSIGDAGLKLIFACILGIGIFAFVTNIMDNAEESKSATWPTTLATVHEIGSHSASMPVIGRFLPVVCPYATYSYTVDNNIYNGEKIAGPSLSFVRAFVYKPLAPKPVDEKELTKQMIQEERDAIKAGGGEDLSSRFQRGIKRTQELMLHPTYDPVTIRYQKDHPEISVLDPEVLQTSKSQMYSSVLLMVVGGLLLGGIFYHQYTTAPNVDDPSLSLEAALAAQKRGRR